MSLPREPRQKMINMMYLVLTALLALNVSSEILNAFKTVNNSLETTNKTVNQSTGTILNSLEEKTHDPSPATAGKAKIWLAHANDVAGYSKVVFDYIQGLKNTILTRAGGDPNNPNKRYKEDNLDIATRMMVDKGEGKKLLAALGKYKSDVLAVDPAINTEFANSLQIDLKIPATQNKSNRTWEAVYFHMVPTVAALTILSKFQNDVKTSENKIVAFCHEQVGKVEYKFDAYIPIVGQSSKYLMPGQELEITAGLGAFSKKNIPTITIGGANTTPDENGVTTFKVPGGGVGPHKIPVVVSFKDQDGNPQVKTYDVEYNVGQANASIALNKMNVLYIGVDNPVTIAASGGGDDKISATINNGVLTKIPGQTGQWNARVNKVDDNTIITVTVDGKVAGASTFRVRTIPDAQAYVGGQPSGSQVSAGAFKAQPGVAAGIKNFPFQLNYDVISFTLTCDTDDDIVSIPTQGALFQGPVKRAIDQNVKAGRMVTIENIKVRNPDGRVVSVPAVFYYIN
jgi:gliding motility-associated protein GldM